MSRAKALMMYVYMRKNKLGFVWDIKGGFISFEEVVRILENSQKNYKPLLTK